MLDRASVDDMATALATEQRGEGSERAQMPKSTLGYQEWPLSELNLWGHDRPPEITGWHL